MNLAIVYVTVICIMCAPMVGCSEKSKIQVYGVEIGSFEIAKQENSPGPGENRRVYVLPENENIRFYHHGPDIRGKIGTIFGFRFHFTSSLPVKRINVRVDLDHPPIRSLDGKSTITSSGKDYTLSAQNHKLIITEGFRFYAAEQLHGVWRYRVSINNELVFEQSFRVTPATEDK